MNLRTNQAHRSEPLVKRKRGQSHGVLYSPELIKEHAVPQRIVLRDATSRRAASLWDIENVASPRAASCQKSAPRMRWTSSDPFVSTGILWRPTGARRHNGPLSLRRTAEVCLGRFVVRAIVRRRRQERVRERILMAGDEKKKRRGKLARRRGLPSSQRMTPASPSSTQN